MQETTDQRAVFDLMSSSATHGGHMVTRMDTHAAAVFLAGEYAYKVKRAVKFPFLDFSTLPRRKAALAAEIEANRPFAPHLYLGLVPIVESGAGLALGGAGEPVEWALQMRRFDETKTLDHLARAGKIDRAMAASLARAVAAAHARAPVADAAAWLAAFRQYITQNEQAFRDYAELFSADAATQVTKKSVAAFEKLHPLLEQRGAQGLVRRGHGDLHLGNIALIDGEPVPFDALEFDPVVASGDVLYDLAFLLMDLVDRKLRAPASVVLNTYFIAANRPDDLDALAALPLFMSIRAAIRAKVTAARLANIEAKAPIAAEARAYFELACRLMSPPSPRLIAIGGLSGTGKSVLARDVAPFILPEPGALVLRSDVERKAMFGIAETEKLPQEAYSANVTSRVYRTLADKARRAFSAGHSVIVDAVFARPGERAAIEDVVRADHSDFCGLFLTADLKTRLARVSGRTGDASDADARIALTQEDYDLDGLQWHRVDASGTPEQTLANARAALAIGRQSDQA